MGLMKALSIDPCERMSSFLTSALALRLQLFVVVFSKRSILVLSRPVYRDCWRILSDFSRLAELCTEDVSYDLQEQSQYFSFD